MRNDPYMPDPRFTTLDEEDEREESRINRSDDRVINAKERVDAFENESSGEASD